LPARAILVATGAQPNIAYAYEHHDTFARSSWSYTPHQSIEGSLHALTDEVSMQSEDIGIFTSYAHGRYRVSFLGDTHPVAHGSVVKAIASAKKAYGPIMSAMAPYQPAVAAEDYADFAKQMQDYFSTTLIAVTQVAPQCTMLRVRAQAATKHYYPGQFYRLQPMARESQGDIAWESESVALLGIMHPDCPDELRFYLFDQGVSSRLLSQLAPGDSLSLMGPTGAALRTAGGPGDSLLVIGGFMAIPYVLALSHATRASGKHLCFVAVVAEESLGGLAQEIASACDAVRYIDEVGELVTAARSVPVEYLERTQEVITIASDTLLSTVRENVALRALFPKDVRYVGSVYGPMQCMLKGVCGQCLQFQIDPETGERKKAVYACSWQHQPMDKIDIPHIEARLSQNSMQAALSRLWQEAMHGADKGATIKPETD
jgi:ferredoxin-NADP reductase